MIRDKKTVIKYITRNLSSNCNEVREQKSSFRPIVIMRKGVGSKDNEDV